MPISIYDHAYLVRKVVGKEKLPIIMQNVASSYMPNNEKVVKEMGLSNKIELKMPS